MLISPEWRALNMELHETCSEYGSKHKPMRIEAIRNIKEKFQCATILDYGAGKEDLKGVLGECVSSYDPCVSGIDADPVSADLLVSMDVLEHVEPEYLENVLSHMRSLSRVVAFLIVGTRLDSSKVMPDGRNPHLIVEPASWWLERIARWWHVVEEFSDGKELRVVCLAS